MRRYRFLIVPMAAILGLSTFTGCDTPLTETKTISTRLSEEFTKEMTLTVDELEANGSLTRTGENEWSVSFDTPTSLAGVMLDFSGNNVTASYKGLGFSIPQNAIAAKSVLSSLIAASEELAAEETVSVTTEEDGYSVQSQVDNCDYVLTLSEDGQLRGFVMDSMNAEITLS